MSRIHIMKKLVVLMLTLSVITDHVRSWPIEIDGVIQEEGRNIPLNKRSADRYENSIRIGGYGASLDIGGFPGRVEGNNAGNFGAIMEKGLNDRISGNIGQRFTGTLDGIMAKGEAAAVMVDSSMVDAEASIAGGSKLYGEAMGKILSDSSIGFTDLKRIREEAKNSGMKSSARGHVKHGSSSLALSSSDYRSNVKNEAERRESNMKSSVMAGGEGILARSRDVLNGHVRSGIFNVLGGTISQGAGETANYRMRSGGSKFSRIDDSRLETADIQEERLMSNSKQNMEHGSSSVISESSYRSNANKVAGASKRTMESTASIEGESILARSKTAESINAESAAAIASQASAFENEENIKTDTILRAESREVLSRSKVELNSDSAKEESVALKNAMVENGSSSFSESSKNIKNTAEVLESNADHFRSKALSGNLENAELKASAKGNVEYESSSSSLTGTNYRSKTAGGWESNVKSSAMGESIGTSEGFSSKSMGVSNGNLNSQFLNSASDGAIAEGAPSYRMIGGRSKFLGGSMDGSYSGNINGARFEGNLGDPLSHRVNFLGQIVPPRVQWGH